MIRLLLFVPLLVGSTLVLAETTRGMDPGAAWGGRITLAAIVWLLLLPLGRAARGSSGGSGGWERGTPPPDPDGIDCDIGWREIYQAARQAGHDSAAMRYREIAEVNERESALAAASAFREEARDEIAEIAADVANWGNREPR